MGAGDGEGEGEGRGDGERISITDAARTGLLTSTVFWIFFALEAGVPTAVPTVELLSPRLSFRQPGLSTVACLSHDFFFLCLSRRRWPLSEADSPSDLRFFVLLDAVPSAAQVSSAATSANLMDWVAGADGTLTMQYQMSLQRRERVVRPRTPIDRADLLVRHWRSKSRRCTPKFTRCEMRFTKSKAGPALVKRMSVISRPDLGLMGSFSSSRRERLIAV